MTASARAWMVVALLWFVAMLNYLDRLIVTTMRESLVQSIPMDDAQFGLLTSSFLWVYAVLSPLGGYLGDRFGRSRVIVASLLVWSLVTWMTTLVQSYSGLVFARALMGISEACYLPAALALIADYHRGPTRSLATGIHITGVYTGAALGGLGGVLAEWYGWRSSFAVFGAIGVAYAVLLALTLRDPATPAELSEPLPEESESLGLMSGILTLIRQPAFLILLTVFSLFSLVNWGILHWSPTYLLTSFGLSQGSAGMSATISNQAGAFVGILLGGFWADRWSRTNGRARVLVPFIGFCLAAPCIILLATTSVLPMALAGFVLYGVGKSFGDANWMPVLCQIADRRYRATGYGVMNLASCLVGGVMPWAAGKLMGWDVSLGTIFLAFGVLYFATAWLFLFIRPQQDGEVGPESC